jgi:hypothetical protein
VTDPTATTTTRSIMNNPQRPPLFELTRTAAGLKKGARVSPVADPEVQRGRLVYEVVVGEPKPGEDQPTYSVPADALHRVFRTADERELRRDFTPEEAEAHRKRWELRLAIMTEERRRREITESVERIAAALERTAETLRRELERPEDLARTVSQVQHELAWLFPNLGAHQLTGAAIEWSTSKQAITRLLTEGIEPA